MPSSIPSPSHAFLSSPAMTEAAPWSPNYHAGAAGLVRRSAHACVHRRERLRRSCLTGVTRVASAAAERRQGRAGDDTSHGCPSPSTRHPPSLCWNGRADQQQEVAARGHVCAQPVRRRHTLPPPFLHRCAPCWSAGAAPCRPRFSTAAQSPPFLHRRVSLDGMSERRRPLVVR
jgi:hypothetical protein